MALIAPQDVSFLLMEAREKPAHVGGMSLFEPPPDAGPHYLLELYESALASQGDVRSLFRKRPVRSGGIGPWSWEIDDQFDIEYHVRHTALPEPGRIRELLTVVSRLHGSLLDRNRPLWEAHLIEGLADGRFAMYTKVHHALVDGVTAMRLLIESMSTDPTETDMPMPWERRARDEREVGEPAPRPRPTSSTGNDTWTSLVTDGLRSLTQAVGGLAGAAEHVGPLLRSFRDQVAAQPLQAPRSVLNVPVTGARRFAADSWPIERIRAVGAPHGATVNDMVLAMSAGALRAYLLELDALPDEPLVAMVPVSLKARGAGDDAGNAVGAILCSLGTHLADPVARLHHIQASMRSAKSRLEGLTPNQILLLSALSVAPAALGMSPLGRIPLTEPLLRPAFNVVISNVPGPREPLYWNGARLVGQYPVSTIIDGQAINITTTSYAGSLDFGIIGCRRAAPRLQRLLPALEDEVAALEAAG